MSAYLMFVVTHSPVDRLTVRIADGVVGVTSGAAARIRAAIQEAAPRLISPVTLAYEHTGSMFLVSKPPQEGIIAVHLTGLQVTAGGMLDILGDPQAGGT